MGIDVHGLNFLRYATTRQPLGDVATLGRQGLNVAPYRLRDLLGDDPPLPPHERYCERLLVDRLGARSVESFDHSPYEGATHTADMNLPVVPPRRYDTVVDGGTLEHIFDIRQALANVSALCADGGQIIHMLPANNLNGHGFWQFSPELFLSLYTPGNGYRDTQVFLTSELLESCWFEVCPTPPGRRINLTSMLRTIVLVRTVRGDQVSDAEVQQSDYVALWSQPEGGPAAVHRKSRRRSAMTIGKAAVDHYQPISRALRGSYYKARSLTVLKSQLSGRHPNLRKVSVAELVSSVR